VRLNRRIERLERKAAVAAAVVCSACGHALAPASGPLQIRCVVPGCEGYGEAPPTPCPVCGRPEVIKIEFDLAG
jgi:hypothetical protein